MSESTARLTLQAPAPGAVPDPPLLRRSGPHPGDLSRAARHRDDLATPRVLRLRGALGLRHHRRPGQPARPAAVGAPAPPRSTPSPRWAIRVAANLRRRAAAGGPAAGTRASRSCRRSPPRIAALAREVTAGSADRYEAAQRLTAWLSRERPTRACWSASPRSIRWKNSCSCAAAATASTSPPRWRSCSARSTSRLAWSTASSAREWNPYGEYLHRAPARRPLVGRGLRGGRGLGDARSVTARQRGDAARRRSPSALWLDALRLSWYRYVINWSLHDQAGRRRGGAADDLVRGAQPRFAMPDVGRLPRLALAVLAAADRPGGGGGLAAPRRPPRRTHHAPLLRAGPARASSARAGADAAARLPGSSRAGQTSASRHPNQR